LAGRIDNRGQQQYARCPHCEGRIEIVPPIEWEYRSWSLTEPSPTVDYKITYAKCDYQGHNVKVFWTKPFFTGYG
jgi:hypothetical protein